MLLTAQRTEKANKELLKDRYDQSHMDGLENCLRRAEGIAGILIDVAILTGVPNAHYDPNPLHIEHTAKALQMEINDAITLLNDLYEQERLAAGDGGADE